MDDPWGDAHHGHGLFKKEKRVPANFKDLEIKVSVEDFRKYKQLDEKFRIAWEALNKISADFGRQSPEMRCARKALKDIAYVGISEGS